MNKSFSIYLDAVRFIAAMIVFFHHFAYERFTDGLYLALREINIGSDAVIIFFVLSGFLIAYTAQAKDKTLKRYAWHRASRLYSVVIVALVLGILLDSAGSSLAPAAYDGWWYNPAPIWQQLLLGLSFTNEWLSEGMRLGTNGPYWSLSYEAMYYMLFGAGFFLTGIKRVVALAVFACLAGVNILLLFPAWLVGLGTYRLIQKGVKLDKFSAILCAFIPVTLYIACLATDIPNQIILASADVLGVETIQSFRFSDEFIWNNLIGLLFAIHLIGVHSLCTQMKDKKTKLQNLIRWCAGASFTIYVVHYPALQFIDAVLPEDITMVLRHGLLLGLALGLCFIVAEISERRLKSMRGFFEKRIPVLKG